jgi:hypothetical protein
VSPHVEKWVFSRSLSGPPSLPYSTWRFGCSEHTLADSEYCAQSALRIKTHPISSAAHEHVVAFSKPQWIAALKAEPTPNPQRLTHGPERHRQLPQHNLRIQPQHSIPEPPEHPRAPRVCSDAPTMVSAVNSDDQLHRGRDEICDVPIANASVVAQPLPPVSKGLQKAKPQTAVHATTPSSWIFVEQSATLRDVPAYPDSL